MTSAKLSLVTKDGTILVDRRIRNMSKLIDQIILDREEEAVEEDFPLENFSKDLINQIIAFCEIENYEGDNSVVKTKPIIKSTREEELFKKNQML